jgi:kynurenine formamidase
MPGYPGLPAPRVGAILDHRQSRGRFEGRAEFYLGRVEMSGNTGTYIDAPFHRYPDREDLSQLGLARIAGLPGILIDATASKTRARELAVDAESVRGCAVLVRTGWDARWRTDAYWELGPHLSAGSVDRLVDAGAALVGVDFWNVDDTTDPSRPAHTRLLAAGVLIVEHLSGLAALPESGFRFFAVPPRLVGGASFPVRAFAELHE